MCVVINAERSDLQEIAVVDARDVFAGRAVAL